MTLSEWCNPRRDSAPTQTLVDDALEALPADGTADTILRYLHDEPAGTLPYSALYANPTLPSESAVRRQLTRLEGLQLVERYGPDHDRRVDLRDAGREYLEARDRDDQLTLDDAVDRVNSTGKCCEEDVEARKHGEGGQGSSPYRTRFLNWPSHHAAAGTATGGVTLVDDAVPGVSEAPDHTRFVGFDDDRDEVVVAVRGTTPLQYMTSISLTCASPRLLERVLTSTRYDGLDDPPAILRDARCIGALSDDALSSAEDLREAFVEWGEELEEMTRTWHRDEYDDRDRFLGDMMRTAHGLAGSLVHLFDALGVSVVRELRVPNRLGKDDLEALAESVAVSTAIQSRYGGAFATYRQLFEARSEKRAGALAPTVDATDPTGELIGSLVIRGSDLHRLRGPLEDELPSPAELHEDAPEFQVPVEITEAGREAVERTAKRVLQRKRLRVTDPAVSVLHGLLSSPYTVAEALFELGGEAIPRAVAGHDLRYALATVDPGAVLPDLPPTIGRVVAALLRAETRVSQRELADRAGVSARSVRNHRDTLEALDLVDVDESGWRFTLPFATPEERHTSIAPSTVTDDVRLADVVSDILAVVLPAAEYANPQGSVHEALSFPPDPWSLRDDPRLEPWLRLAARLTGSDPPASTSTVAMGPPIEQTPVASEAEVASG